MGIAVYLNFFVLVTQLFLKVPALHALAPNAPDNPEPPFLIAQVDRAGDLHLADLESGEEFPAGRSAAIGFIRLRSYHLTRRRSRRIAGVRRAGRFDQQQVNFLARDRAMLDAFRHHEQLARA